MRQSFAHIAHIAHIALIVRDYVAMRARGITFVREPATHAYGTVAVFADLYGNLWDLVQPAGEQTA